jgi:hypothetical protein
MAKEIILKKLAHILHLLREAEQGDMIEEIEEHILLIENDGMIEEDMEECVEEWQRRYELI